MEQVIRCGDQFRTVYKSKHHKTPTINGKTREDEGLAFNGFQLYIRLRC